MEGKLVKRKLWENKLILYFSFYLLIFYYSFLKIDLEENWGENFKMFCKKKEEGRKKEGRKRKEKYFEIDYFGGEINIVYILMYLLNSF